MNFKKYFLWFSFVSFWLWQTSAAFAVAHGYTDRCNSGQCEPLCCNAGGYCVSCTTVISKCCSYTCIDSNSDQNAGTVACSGRSCPAGDGRCSAYYSFGHGALKYKQVATATDATVNAGTGTSGSTGTLSTSGVAAPVGLTYANNVMSGVVGTAIAINRPTVTGAALSYSVSPALPSGLVLNAATGVISGTPSAPADGTYTVKATNSAGFTTKSLTIKVITAAQATLLAQLALAAAAQLPKPPALTYSATASGCNNTSGCFYFKRNSSAYTWTPTNTGGKITGCTVSPALPAGLSISTSTCGISGTPTASYSGWRTFTVTAKSGTLIQTKVVSINVVP